MNAEFIRWKTSNQHVIEEDSIQYVVELETDEEAQTRLDSLIIERMSSKPGWSYVLKSASFREFTEDSVTTLSPGYNEGSETNTLMPDSFVEAQILDNDETRLVTEVMKPETGGGNPPDLKLDEDPIQNDQLMDETPSEELPL